MSVAACNLGLKCLNFYKVPSCNAVRVMIVHRCGPFYLILEFEMLETPNYAYIFRRSRVEIGRLDQRNKKKKILHLNQLENQTLRILIAVHSDVLPSEKEKKKPSSESTLWLLS